MEFIAIDVETANSDIASICQIGLVHYLNGELVEQWKTYINPEDEFNIFNIKVHGIDESTVQGAPKFYEIVDKLNSFFDNKIVVSHTHFDIDSISQAAEKYGIENPECVWLDSARVTRRTWKEFATKGYGLHNVCKYLGYEFKHHDALEDAKAAAHILLKAMECTNLDIQDWLQRVEEPINTQAAHKKIKREGNSEGPLYGETLVFTGALEMPRREAADIAAKIGCKVLPGVNKQTTMLVVGDRDVRHLSGTKKSSKHRKAEELMAKGSKIRIITETDFIKIAKISG